VVRYMVLETVTSLTQAEEHYDLSDQSFTDCHCLPLLQHGLNHYGLLPRFLSGFFSRNYSIDVFHSFS